jgi:hypothetical protein
VGDSPLVARVQKFRPNDSAGSEGLAALQPVNLGSSTRTGPSRSDSSLSSEPSELQPDTEKGTWRPALAPTHDELSAMAPAFVPGQNWAGRSRSGFMD